MSHSVRKILESGACVVPHKLPEHLADMSTHVDWSGFLTDSILQDVDTTVALEKVREVGEVFEDIPLIFSCSHASKKS